jgi:hypothetical protein
MISYTTLCDAISGKRIVSFYCNGGMRVVEPHMVAKNEADHYALSGWFLRGHSKSGGTGWREYLLAEMSNLEVLEETFSGPRPGYRAAASKVFPHVICRM